MSPCIDGAGDVRKQVGDEFREWPGLQLTVAQASRLWHTDRATIQRVLDELVKEGQFAGARLLVASCRSLSRRRLFYNTIIGSVTSMTNNFNTQMSLMLLESPG